MHLYEHIFMARQDVSSQQVDALVEQFKTVLEKEGGKVGKIENWGLKNLPYRVKKNKKAHYALMNVTAPPDAIKEMERQMRLHEDVIRYLTVRVEEHEEGPSAMLQKNERDDRDGDRDGGFGGRSAGRRSFKQEDTPVVEETMEEVMDEIINEDEIEVPEEIAEMNALEGEQDNKTEKE